MLIGRADRPRISRAIQDAGGRISARRFPILLRSRRPSPGAGPSEVETLGLQADRRCCRKASMASRTLPASASRAYPSSPSEFLLSTNDDVAAGRTCVAKVEWRPRSPTPGRELPDDRRRRIPPAPRFLYMTMRSTSGRSSRDLRDLADQTIKDQLGQVSGCFGDPDHWRRHA